MQMTNIPISRAQMLIARTGVGILLVLIPTMLLRGPAPVRQTEIDGTTVFTSSPVDCVFPAVMGVPIVLAGVVFALQRGIFFKLIATVLLVGATVSLPIMLTVPFFHRAVLAPDSYYLRIGWFAFPEEYKVQFDSVQYVQISEDRSSDQREGMKRYVLEFFIKPAGEVVAVPICDLVKPALPQILSAVAKRGVIVGESPQGWQIPPDLQK